MSWAEDSYSLYELQRRFVRLQPAAGTLDTFHLVLRQQIDGGILIACGQTLVASQLAEDLLDAAEPASFCSSCRRRQAYQI